MCAGCTEVVFYAIGNCEYKNHCNKKRSFCRLSALALNFLYRIGNSEYKNHCNKKRSFLQIERAGAQFFIG